MPDEIKGEAHESSANLRASYLSRCSPKSCEVLEDARIPAGLNFDKLFSPEVLPGTQTGLEANSQPRPISESRTQDTSGARTPSPASPQDGGSQNRLNLKRTLSAPSETDRAESTNNSWEIQQQLRRMVSKTYATTLVGQI